MSSKDSTLQCSPQKALLVMFSFKKQCSLILAKFPYSGCAYFMHKYYKAKLENLMEVFCLNLSKMVASTLRQNILRELSMTREIRMIKFVVKLRSTYTDVNRNLLLLEKEGIVISDYPDKVRHGRVRIIRLNRDNPKTKTLLDVLKILDSDK